MLRQRNFTQSLYLLAALVLLLQSFAIWHDTAHPFHTAEAQCERLEALSHTPTLDSISALAVHFATNATLLNVINPSPLRAHQQFSPQLIRGPPVLS